MGPLLLAALVGLAHGAESRAPRVLDALAAGRVDRAVDLCFRWRESGLAEDEREACAEASLRALPAGDRGALDAHWAEWEGTAAARESRERAADLRLREAVGDLRVADRRALEEVAAHFPDTRAGQGALEVLWKLAWDAGTSAAMADFLGRWPEAPQAEQARARMLDLAYEEAAARQSVVAWREFLARWPDHPRVEEARRWEQALAFRDAERAGTSAGWEALLRDHPHHPRRDEAERALVDARFREAEAGDDPAALLALALAHPEYPRAALLRARAAGELVRVAPVSAGRTDPAWWPARGGSAVELPGRIESIEVRWPEGVGAATAHLDLERGGVVGPLAEGLAASLGLARAQAQRAARVDWAPVGEHGLVGAVAQPLCQPPGDVAFAVVVHLGEEDLVYRLKAGEPCR